MAETEAQIEVEEKFRPTEESKKSLLGGAEFLGIVNNHDIYFDNADFSFLKNGIRLRNRNGIFELKIKKGSGRSLEIINTKEIEDYLKTDNLERYIKEEGLKIVADYNTERHVYKKDDFFIHDDKTDFGYKVCEIERLLQITEDGGQDNIIAKRLRKEVINFAAQYGWEKKNLVSKWAEYLKKFNPEAYNEIFKEKIDEKVNEKNNVLEFKMK